MTESWDESTRHEIQGGHCTCAMLRDNAVLPTHSLIHAWIQHIYSLIQLSAKGGPCSGLSVGDRKGPAAKNNEWKQMDGEMEGDILRGCFSLLCESTVLMKLWLKFTNF